MKSSFPAILIISISSLFAGVSAQTWTDITTAEIAALGGQVQNAPWLDLTGCGGICVNRLTGDVIAGIIQKGLYKSSDKGVTWTQIDQNTVYGKGESGQEMQVDQDNPARMGMFCLDGKSGYTADGTTWKQMTNAPQNPRGWDFGSIDWATPAAKIMIAVVHESNPGSLVDLSTNGGTSWAALSVSGAKMVGVIDSNTFIYSTGTGVQRSTDRGQNWSQVATVAPSVYTPVMFKGKCYLGAGTSLLVSSDKGATWQAQGLALTYPIYRGPCFGADENTFVVATYTGDVQTGPRYVYKTIDAGAHWTLLSSDGPPVSSTQFHTMSTWWGSMTWDPINNVLYTAAISNPAYKKQLNSTSVDRWENAAGKSSSFSVTAVSLRGLAIETQMNGTVSVYTAAGILADAFPVNARTASIRAISSPGVYLVKFSSSGATQSRLVAIR
jgi:hypothetical protein